MSREGYCLRFLRSKGAVLTGTSEGLGYCNPYPVRVAVPHNDSRKRVVAALDEEKPLSAQISDVRTSVLQPWGFANITSVVDLALPTLGDSTVGSNAVFAGGHADVGKSGRAVYVPHLDLGCNRRTTIDPSLV